MAADGEDKELTLEEFEEQLRDVGARLQSAPDDAEGLLKLLSEVETYLLKVEQSPPESTSRAIRPAIDALARKELLSHLNADVRLAVASCISEITRVTAPEAPYDDDVMRDVFFIIVGAFEHLDEIESPSFGRRVSILDTVAKVRSCVVMLDLECDDLIREMFHHFFRIVSSNHPDIVISSMVTTMKLVIEESEDVSTELASCLLRNVKNEEKETAPASFELAEKVIGLCHEKLKPVFLQLLQGTPLNEYSKIVTSVLDVREDNNVDPFGKDTVDDGKLSERTISDELPQDSSEQDVSRPEQDVAPTTVISSGATPVDNGAESVAAKPKKSSDIDSDKDPKLKPSFKSEAVARSNVDIDNTKVVIEAAHDTSKPADSAPVVVKPKRGRPPGPKSLEKKAAGKNYLSSLDLKKAVAAESAGKLTKLSAKDGVKSSTRKAGEGESSKKQQKISSKQQKDEALSEEDTAKDLSLKFLALKDLDNITAETMLLLWSMKERCNLSSKFKIYFETLPANFNTGLSFGIDALTALEGTLLFDELMQARQHLWQQYNELFPMLCTNYPEIFKQDIYTWDNFLWACELWYSNSMMIVLSSGKLATCLVPVAGLLNHSVSPHILNYGRVDKATKSLKFPLSRPCEAGKQCYLSYGKHPGSHLITFYGFLPRGDNPYDVIPLDLDTSTDEEDVTAQSVSTSQTTHMVRGTWLSRSGGSPMYGLPERLLSHLRAVLNCDHNESTPEADMKENDRVVLETLLSIFNPMLEGLGETDDLNRENASWDMKLALGYKDLQRRIISSIVTSCTSGLAMLDS